MPSAADIVAGRAAVELVIDRSQLKPGLAAASQEVKKGVAGSTTQLSAPAGAETVVLQKGVADVNAQTVIMKKEIAAAHAETVIMKTGFEASARSAGQVASSSRQAKTEVQQTATAASTTLTTGFDQAARAVQSIDRNMRAIRSAMMFQSIGVGLQDFVTVVANGGNLSTAIGAISNNLIQMASLMNPIYGGWVAIGIAIGQASLALYKIFSASEDGAEAAKRHRKELEQVAQAAKQVQTNADKRFDRSTNAMRAVDDQEDADKKLKELREDKAWHEWERDVKSEESREAIRKWQGDPTAANEAAKDAAIESWKAAQRKVMEDDAAITGVESRRENLPAKSDEKIKKEKDEAEKKAKADAESIRKQSQSPWEKERQELEKVEELRKRGDLTETEALHARVKIYKEREEAVRRDAESQPVSWNDDLAKKAMEQGISLQEARNSQARGVKPIIVRADDASMTKEMKERAKAFNGQEFLGEDGSTQVYRYIEKQAEKDQKTIRGTFSGSALGGLGGSADRQLKASEATAKNTSKMLQKLDKVAGPTWA